MLPLDILLISVGALLVLIGLLGSFVPVIPGAIPGWLALLAIHLSSVVQLRLGFLLTTLVVALLIFILDLIVPVLATKHFGGTKRGVIGSTVGLVIGLIFFPPFGILLGPFFGAFIGEISATNSSKGALKIAFGSLLGFLSGAFLKFIIGMVFLFYFIKILLFDSSF